MRNLRHRETSNLVKVKNHPVQNLDGTPASDHAGPAPTALQARVYVRALLLKERHLPCVPKGRKVQGSGSQNVIQGPLPVTNNFSGGLLFL